VDLGKIKPINKGNIPVKVETVLVDSQASLFEKLPDSSDQFVISDGFIQITGNSMSQERDAISDVLKFLKKLIKKKLVCF